MDHKLLMKREVNKEVGTIDYVHDVNGKKNSVRKHGVALKSEAEKGRLILQIGTSDAVRALKATNCDQGYRCCGFEYVLSKHFRVHSGMGWR